MTQQETTPTVPMGAIVFSHDGVQLGTVKELAFGRFKVDAPMQLDYWLDLKTVSLTGKGYIELSLTGHDVLTQRHAVPVDAPPYVTIEHDEGTDSGDHSPGRVTSHR